jgi:hypothetical protein
MQRTGAASSIARYSAWAPVPANPKTASPGWKRETRAPVATTTPANSPPRIARRGPRSPMARRPRTENAPGKSPARCRQSADVTVVARTETRISVSRGAGFGASRMVIVPGEP